MGLRELGASEVRMSQSGVMAMGAIDYRFVVPSDPLFEQARLLRWEILRKPLGIAYRAEMDDMEPGKQHLIAVDGSSVVGYCCVIVRSDGAQIRHMSVAESMRGRGVGQEMARKLIERAKQSGASVIWLNARFNALEFWHKIGFVDTGGFFNSEETSLPHKRLEYRGRT